MAIFVLTDAVITINSVALSSYSNSVVMNYEIDSVESTSFGSTGHKFVGGLQNNSMDVELFQDYASNQVEATIYPLVGTQTTVVIKATSDAVGATNPEYTLTNCFLAAHQPVGGGGVGEMAATSLSFTGGVLTKAVS